MNEKAEIRIKVVPSMAGTQWDAGRAYRLLDYITIDSRTIYLCCKVDDATGTNTGHALTETEWWDKCIDLSDVAAKAEAAAAAANAADKKATEAEKTRAAAEEGRVAAETERGRQFDALKTAADSATAAAKAAAADAAGAENVDADITAANVLEITRRSGEKKTLDLVAQADADSMRRDVERVKKSLGAYSDRPSISLAVKESGVAISADGVKVSKAGWAIAEFTAELGNEYLFKPGATDGSVCVFAEYIDKVERRAIEYTYTYDEKGRTATAKATYDGKTHSYTYAYAATDNGETYTITDDATGLAVDCLPATFLTKVGSYQPLTLLNAGAELPEDGYCRFVSNFQTRGAIRVVVSYRTGAADMVMPVVRDGMTASMCTQLSKINQKVDETKATAETLQKRMNLFGDAFAGFARISGDADPKPAAEYVYGSRRLIQEIGRHMKIGTVKRVGNDAVLQHECAPGRITLASNGEAVAVDGTEGDLLVYTDIPLYMIRGNGTLDGFGMSCMGVGVVPCYWQDTVSKRLEPFAISPFYTVNTQLAGDERTCAHCIISDKIKGSGSAATGTIKNALNTDGMGYPSNAISGLNSIQMAQNKNADAATNRPYMGCYYEFYELWIMMMYAEIGTLAANDLYCMGTGCTHTNIADGSTWATERMAANSGVKMFTADGAEAGYTGIMEQSWKKGADGTAGYNTAAMFGGTNYVITKNGELLKVLDGITRAGLQDKVGNAQNIFHFGTDGNMVCTGDGSINVATGEGMEVNKRYYVVRDVPNCQGIADGVMTAVANCYIRMEFADGVYSGSTDMTGGYVICKLSHSCYRGLSIPMDGQFRQTSGAYYTTERLDGNYINKFFYAKKWQDVAPLTNKVCYTDIDKTDGIGILKGLSGMKGVSGASGWVKKADYGLSLFCFDTTGASSGTAECCYIWNNNNIWGEGVNGLPEEGKFCVKALAVGCDAHYGGASARTVFCNNAVSYGNSYFAGALAVPQLKLA